MKQTIDWERLARQLDLLHENGESGGTDSAQKAVKILIGDEPLRAAVDHYVAGQKGSELVRSVLQLLHPKSAMERCYEIFRSDSNIEKRIWAVELLRVMHNPCMLPWIDEFLNDQDPSIQYYGAQILDQLHFYISDEERDHLIRRMLVHSNEQVREIAFFIEEFIKDKKIPIESWSMQSLTKLENDNWGKPKSSADTAKRLRRKPLRYFSAEDLRWMIEERFSIPILVPMAVDLLKNDPLVGGDMPRGALLKSVLSIDPKFWQDNPILRQRMKAVLDDVGVIREFMDCTLLPMIHTFR